MFLRALSAEMLKYRRTSALFLAVGVPVAINLLFLLIYALTPRLQQMPLEGRWEMFLQGGMSTWTQLFLPLGLGIIAALALNLEHGDNQWKHVLVLGPSRVAVYLAKLLAVVSLVLLGSVALGVSALLIGGAVTGFQSIPWADLARGPALTFVGGLGIVAVQTWLATRFKAFGSSLGVALFGAIVGGAAINSQTYWKFVPWSYPAGAYGLQVPNNELAMLLSVAVALVVTALAAWDFNRRDML
jgi:lantibiotic transport system permease protein